MTVGEYEQKLALLLKKTPSEQLVSLYRLLCRTDLYFLCRYVLKLEYFKHPWLFARCVEVNKNPNSFIDLWGRDMNKALNLKEIIHTANGPKEIGEVEVGDKIFSSDGKLTRVIALSEIFTTGVCYKVSFDRGNPIVCDKDHLWNIVYNQPSAKNIAKGRVYKTLTTDKIKTLISTHNVRIEQGEPLEYSEKQFSIPPYILGYWLGDGTSNQPAVATHIDDLYEIEKRFGELGYFGNTKALQNNCAYFYIDSGTPHHTNSNHFTKGLRELDLIKNKHIPEEYFYGSIEQRFELVRGLMDSDGSVSNTGKCSFTNINENIIKGLSRLLSSLGIVNNVVFCERIDKRNGKTYCAFYLKFHTTKDKRVFNLSRKVAKSKNSTHLRSISRQIISIDEIPYIPTRCIQVENPSGMFLVGNDYIPTHNSTIITYALTIQDILSSHGQDPDIKWKGREATIGIFSYNTDKAVSFLNRIKQTLETNTTLKELFPDILYPDPNSEAPKWSQNGLVVKRVSTPKECTVEAYGIIKTRPTGSHFLICVYDDMVTREGVANSDMIKATKDAWADSLHLSTEGGVRRYIGTRYHLFDLYHDLIEEKVVTPRIYPATEGGEPNGKSVYLSEQTLAEKRKGGIADFSAQMLLKPLGDELNIFDIKHLRYYDYTDSLRTSANIYIIVDPAGTKTKQSDFTAMWVIALAPDNNYYILDLIRDKLNLIEATKVLFTLHRRWRPKGVGWEKYGAQRDIEHIKDVQNRENYRFEIIELGGNQLSKKDRIARLIPLFEEHRIYLPVSLLHMNYEKRTVDVIKEFIEDEFAVFPLCKHDDMLDCLARIKDPKFNAVFPTIHEGSIIEAKARRRNQRGSSGWAM